MEKKKTKKGTPPPRYDEAFNIGPTAEVKKIIRPIYNFKAGDED